jgi:hypothetical protein
MNQTGSPAIKLLQYESQNHEENMIFTIYLGNYFHIYKSKTRIKINTKPWLIAWSKHDKYRLIGEQWNSQTVKQKNIKRAYQRHVYSKKLKRFRQRKYIPGLRK